MSENGNGNGSNGTRHRSPIYPSDDLETSVGRLRDFWDANSNHRVNVEVAIEGWGYSPTGSTGKRLVAALLHYELLEDSGSGSDRMVWVSELGKDVVAPPTENRRNKALREAALNPRIYRKLWDQYGANLPARGAVERFLLDEGFNHKVIDTIIDDYESTIQFAGLDDTPPHEDAEEGTEEAAQTSETQEPDEGTDETRNQNERRGRDDEAPMPGTNASSEKENMDLVVRLPDGSRAVLRIPVPMKEGHFEYLRKVLDANLDLQKEGLTTASKE